MDPWQYIAQDANARRAVSMYMDILLPTDEPGPGPTEAPGNPLGDLIKNFARDGEFVADIREMISEELGKSSWASTKVTTEWIYALPAAHRSTIFTTDTATLEAFAIITPESLLYITPTLDIVLHRSIRPITPALTIHSLQPHISVSTSPPPSSPSTLPNSPKSSINPLSFIPRTKYRSWTTRTKDRYGYPVCPTSF